jgi:hypothetical protein
MTGEPAKALTDTLYHTYDVHMVWSVMGVVGILTAAGIYLHGRWILALSHRRKELQ